MSDANVGDRPNLMDIGKAAGGCGCGGECGCGGHDEAHAGAGHDHVGAHDGGHHHGHSHEHMQAKLDRLARPAPEATE